jgi:hypothetical protein
LIDKNQIVTLFYPLSFTFIMIDTLGFLIGALGGIGFGVLIGSEFSGRMITLGGALLLSVCLVAMILLRIKKKSVKSEK